MIETPTDAPATAASTTVVSRIDVHGSSLAVLGIAIAPLTVGSSCAAAINGIRNRPMLITDDVHASGDMIPVNTESTDSTATSAVSVSSVTRVRPAVAARDLARSA